MKKQKKKYNEQARVIITYANASPVKLKVHSIYAKIVRFMPMRDQIEFITMH